MITLTERRSPGIALPPPQIGYWRWERIFCGLLAIGMIMGLRAAGAEQPPAIDAIMNMARTATERAAAGEDHKYVSAGDDRKNVLFIAVDDLRPTLGCYGDAAAKTPHIDRLAKRGMVFNRAYAQQAVCNPSRASLMTGLRPDTIKVWDLETHFRKNVPDVVTLPQYFKQHGYHAQSVGKIYHDPGWAQDAESWSVAETLAITEGKGKYALKGSRPAKGTNKGVAAERAPVADDGYIDGQASEAAVEILGQVKDKPFFLAVGFRRPHLPFSAPEKYWAMYDREELPLPKPGTAPEGAPQVAMHNFTELRGYRDIPKSGDLSEEKTRELIHGYYASVSYVDAQIGRVLEELDRLELTSRTIVVLLSDHGYHLGEKGLWCKTTNFELDTRVPLILADPEQKVKGTSTSTIAELVDVYPTLVEAAGLPKREGLEGKSLWVSLNLAGTIFKFSAYSQFPRLMPSKGKKAEVMGRSVRTNRHRYTEWQKIETGEVIAQELYDHRADPDELNNLAANNEYGDRLDYFRTLLARKFKWPGSDELTGGPQPRQHYKPGAR